MDLKYDDIENGVRDFLRLSGRETNQLVISILTEMVIMISYSSSEVFNLLNAPKFVEHVNNYIKSQYLRNKATFKMSRMSFTACLEDKTACKEVTKAFENVSKCEEKPSVKLNKDGSVSKPRGRKKKTV